MTPSARWTVFLLICVVLGCGRAEPERAPEPLPPPVRPARAPIVVESGDVVLDGSWFVRYRTIATPFLDVAFRGSAQPSKVRVDLRGPEQAFEGIELTWSKEDGEWQHPIKWLPDPLPAGLWWVAVVEAELADGQLLRYSTSHPSKPYSLSRAKAGADSPSTQATTIRPGAFTAPATGADLLRIETGPVPGTPQADPILHVFDPTDLEVWFAVNDDFEVDSPYPALVLDPGDRTELLIRVSGAEDDQGTYHLKVSRGAVDETLAVEGARDRDLFEEEDSPEKARRLPMGHSRIRQIGALRPDGTRDQDWFRVVLREE